MNNEQKYRHEIKYQIANGEYILLSNRLKHVMKLDMNADDDGFYDICSLYFDNYNDKALKEKLDGVRIRDKFRIRYYNHNLSYIVLEKKSKHNNLCLKQSCCITKEECERIIEGNIEWMRNEYERPLLMELYEAYVFMQMRPKTIVSYRRQVLIYDPGNVRITFDMDIKTTLNHIHFLDTAYPLMPIEQGIIVMEVKYDEYLPQIIDIVLQLPYIRAGAFSKYAFCRSCE